MGRKIGNFTNPDNGQNFSMHTDNLPHLPAIPTQVTRFKDVRETLVTYRFLSNDKNKTVQLVAEYEYNGEKLQAVQEIDEEIFARQLAENAFADNTVDSSAVVIEGKELALQEIGEVLLDAGAILGNASLGGIGFVYAKDQRVISIESMLVVAYQNGTADITLRNCVGHAALKNLIDPYIVFFTDRHKLEIRNYSLKVDNNDLVRNYVITTADINILAKDEDIKFAIVAYDPSDDEKLEEFLEGEANKTNIKSGEEGKEKAN